MCNSIFSFIAAKSIKQEVLFSHLSAKPRKFLSENEPAVLWVRKFRYLYSKRLKLHLVADSYF